MAFRRKIWIDHQVQGVLLGRVFIYWLAGLLYFGITVYVSNYYENPNWTVAQQFKAWMTTVGPWLPSAVLILPLVLFDIVRLSHQFVGPVHRARMQLERIVQSPNCTPYTLRTDDYWHNLIKPMNDIQNLILSLHVALQKATEALNSEESSVSKSSREASQGGDETEPSRTKVVCLDAANFQVLEESSSAS